MTKSRNKREGWYHLRIQGEYFRTSKKRNALRYNYKPGSPAWIQDLINESQSKPKNMGYFCVEDINVNPMSGAGMIDCIFNLGDVPESIK